MPRYSNPELNTIRKANEILRLRNRGLTFPEIEREKGWERSSSCNLVNWLKRHPEFIEKGGELHESN